MIPRGVVDSEETEILKILAALVDSMMISEVMDSAVVLVADLELDMVQITLAVEVLFIFVASD